MKRWCIDTVKAASYREATMVGGIHAALGALALLLGGWIFVAAKGTRAHVRLGWAYAACMGGVNVTALCIYRLTGGPNVFHALAVASLAMTGIGLAQPLFRRRLRRWVWRHYQYMSWSYVGLLAATTNEALVRVPTLRRLTAHVPGLPLIASTALVAAGALVIFSYQRRVLASLPASAHGPTAPGDIDRKRGERQRPGED